MDRWETDSKKNVPTNTEIAIYRSSSRWKIALFAVGFEDVGNLIAARETTNYSSYAQVILAAWLTDRIEKGPRLSLVIGAAGVASMVVDVISISGYRIRYTRPYPARGITIHFGTMDIVGEWRVTDRRGFCGMPAQNASPSLPLLSIARRRIWISNEWRSNEDSISANELIGREKYWYFSLTYFRYRAPVLEGNYFPNYFHRLYTHPNAPWIIRNIVFHV